MTTNELITYFRNLNDSPAWQRRINWDEIRFPRLRA